MPDPIAAIETFRLKGGGDQGAYGAPYGFFVKVTTSSGLVGYGESDTMPEVADAVVHAPFLNEMLSGLAAVLIGQDATDPAAVWQRMVIASYGYGRDGASRHAMAALDIALWDIAAKAKGLPVHALIGGAKRMSVPAYVSHPLGSTLDETERYARKLADQGFTAVKFGWHPLGLDLEGDEAIVRTLRQALGPDATLLIDGGLAFDVPGALARADRFRRYDVAWFEEPLRPYDVAGYARLTAQSPVPIAAGEMAAARDELALLIEAKAVNVLQVDLSRTGFTEAIRIGALAERHGIPCVNHTYSYLLNAAASIHFAAAVHDTVLFESQVTPNEIREALNRGQLAPREGVVTVPDTPGLGIEVDEDVLRRFRVGGAIAS